MFKIGDLVRLKADVPVIFRNGYTITSRNAICEVIRLRNRRSARPIRNASVTDTIEVKVLEVLEGHQWFGIPRWKENNIIEWWVQSEYFEIYYESTPIKDLPFEEGLNLEVL